MSFHLHSSFFLCLFFIFYYKPKVDTHVKDEPLNLLQNYCEICGLPISLIPTIDQVIVKYALYHLNSSTFELFFQQ
jgi:hypothetical protein